MSKTLNCLSLIIQYMMKNHLLLDFLNYFSPRLLQFLDHPLLNIYNLNLKMLFHYFFHIIHCNQKLSIFHKELFFLHILIIANLNFFQIFSLLIHFQMNSNYLYYYYLTQAYFHEFLYFNLYRLKDKKQ